MGKILKEKTAMSTQLTANPFQSLTKIQHSSALVETESQRAIQEVQAAMTVAKRFPRDQQAASDRVLNACTRKTLAETALYSYNRGGTDVTGPSIRLAEAIAQNWGNIQFGIRELSQENKMSTVEAFAWDLETNTRQVKVFQVPHVRYSKKGVTELTDPRDIYEIVANQGARRLRACILGVIPGDVIEAAVEQCDKTLITNTDTSPDNIKKLIDAFATFNITVEMLQNKINKRIESINPAQMVQLRKIYISLKDGMSVVADWFEVPSRADELNAKLKAEPEVKNEAKTQASSADRDNLIVEIFNLAESKIDAINADKNLKAYHDEHSADGFEGLTTEQLRAHKQNLLILGD